MLQQSEPKSVNNLSIDEKMFKDSPYQGEKLVVNV